MGILNLFSRPAPTLLRLPTGCFTVDRQGQVLVGTVPSSFPTEMLEAIAAQVLRAFKASADTQLPLAELVVNYPSLKITARELRGGAMVFLSTTGSNAPNQPC